MPEIGNRTMTRTVWKWWYRQQRIILRECAKAHMDALLFGTGCVRISDDGFINHVLPEAIYAQS